MLLALTRKPLTSQSLSLSLWHQLAASRQYATAPSTKTDGPAPYVPPAADAIADSVPPLAGSSISGSKGAGRAGTGIRATLDDIKAENDRTFASLSPAEKEAKLAKDKRGVLINIGLVTVGAGLLGYSYFFPPPAAASSKPHSTVATAAGVPQKPTV